ncbi:MAG TPA: TonB-dependent receptor, partial [Candidatus Didemnitutus sp.]|nr:TonB-dependent receptor [Candidatus Didemnitutus sp.]
VGIAPYAQYAVNAGLPYSALGVYKDKSLTDSSIFDFYNSLLDGPNKREWQNFRTYNISLAQTFLHEHIGFEATYNNEWYTSGQTSLLTGDKQAIGIDFNSVYSDGSPAGINGESHADGTKNPNVGRAYVSDKSAFGNSSYESNRDDRRLTVFGDYDFNSGDKQNWFTKLLGRHTVTGLFSDNT